MTSDVRRTVVALGCLILAFAALVVWKGLDLVSDVDGLNDDVANLSAAYEEARADDPALPPAEDVIDEPAPRDGVDGDPGERGSPGERGRDPTTAEIAAAVASYLLEHPPEGGQAPTSAEVLAAVSVYCGDNQCDGRDGIDGGPGVEGAPGPGPSDEQVAASVAAYCDAHNQCAGPSGQRGPAPTSFTFEWANQSYVCRDDDGDGNYSCEGSHVIP